LKSVAFWHFFFKNIFLLGKSVFQNETLVREVSKIEEYSLEDSMVSVRTGTQFYSTGK
jgi:hypothetical protein